MPTLEEFTQGVMEEEGEFRVFPIAWTLEEKDSGSVAIAMKLAIQQKWLGKEDGWSEIYPIGWYTEHRAWIVGKKKVDETTSKPVGEAPINDATVKRLKECGIWDGDWDKLELQPPNVFMLASISGDDKFDGRMRWRTDWLNPNADEPKPRGQFAPIDRGMLERLRAKHQSKTKALGISTPAGSSAAPPQVAPSPPAFSLDASSAGLPSAPAVPDSPGAPAATSIPPPQAAPSAAGTPQQGASISPPAWGAPSGTGAPTTPAAAAPSVADASTDVSQSGPPAAPAQTTESETTKGDDEVPF